MGALSIYLRNVAGGGLTFWCPGCKEVHTVWHGEGPGPRWGWNGSADETADDVFECGTRAHWDLPAERNW